MRFDIITIFPHIFDSYLQETILSRAQKKKLINIRIHDLRKFAPKNDVHKSVDDRPYGGGPGMILKIEPFFRALKKLLVIRYSSLVTKKKTRVIMLTPEGRKLTQTEGARLAKYDRIVLLCGRYEGFDARVEKLVDEKISIGDYVLAGGELPAMVLTEVVARHVPGVVGHKDALKEETFSKGLDYVEYPQYTRPEVFYPEKKNKRKAWRVPNVLLSGNHGKIKEWREKHK